MRKIVVGYDASEESQRALERATSIAKAFDAQLIIASVAPIMPGWRSAPVDPTDSPEKHAGELQTARAYLDGQDAVAEYVTGSGEPADAIVALASERDADLIVVGTRELGIVQRLLGQSVSGSVVHHAHRDVLIVH